MKVFLAHMLITRPINSLLTGFAIVLSILVYSNWNIDILKLIIGFITGYAGSAAAMCVNDYVDVETDSINKPWKPIPSGLVSRSKALYMSIGFLLIAVLINIFDSKLLTVALIYGSTSYFYSFLKKYWWRHLIVCFSTTAPIVYGYVASNMPREYLYFTLLYAATMFTATFGREIVKAIMDIEGDRENNYMTIPLKYGLDTSKKLLYATCVSSIITGLVAGCTLKYIPIPYIVLILTAGSVYSYYLLKTANSINNNFINMNLLMKTRKITLLAMFIGIVALVTVSL